MIKKSDIPKEELQARKFLNRLWKELRFGSKRLVKWLFFYKPEDNMDALLHVIAVCAWLYLGIFVMSK
jgi:uncharacterized membrane protein YkvA (DUF1232 family)